MEATTPRPRPWKTLLAFAIIYFVWGSTFLGIRIGVREVPPFLFAGIRFFTAGVLLYFWMRVKGTPRPTRREWSSLLLLALLIFVMDYGLLQHDLDGEQLFQHRNQAKWVLRGENPVDVSFQHGQACLAALTELAGRWSGRIDVLPGGRSSGSCPLPDGRS